MEPVRGSDARKDRAVSVSEKLVSFPQTPEASFLAPK